jgi:hypothetical protein
MLCDTCCSYELSVAKMGAGARTRTGKVTPSRDNGVDDSDALLHQMVARVMAAESTASAILIGWA